MVFILCIISPGRLIKNVGRDVMDRDFVYIYRPTTLIFYGTYFIGRRALANGTRVWSWYDCAAQRFGGQLAILNDTRTC